LYALTQDIRVQTKLREELLAVETDTPTMDELNALPYLDMVVRETMRIHAPVPSTIRVATKDDILPLNAPFKDKKGVLHDGIRYLIFQTTDQHRSRTHVFVW
jgi:cytochrome P450